MYLTLFLFLLIIKHAIADLFLQTYHKGIQKDRYFGNGHRHYAEHGVCTFIVSGCFLPLPLALLAALIDYVLHWHIDSGKTLLVKKLGWKRNELRFWRLQTLDQILHFSTYMLIVFVFQAHVIVS